MRALIVTAALLAVTGRARADERDEAVVHFEAGRKAFEAGEYETAVADFKAAYDDKPHPDVLINIATTYERMYRAEDARRYYERYLAEAPPGDSELRKLAEKRLKILRQLPGSILVDPGRKGAEITLTGTGYSRTEPSPFTFLSLPPGPYHVHIAHPDHVSIDEDITLAPGETHAVTERLQHQLETLTVLSVPDGARVFVDDHDEGPTPISRPLEVGVGKMLRLEYPDHPPYLEKFTLEAGKPLFRRITMPSPPRSGRTELILGSMVFGGYVATALAITIGGSRVTNDTNGLYLLLPTAAAGVGLGFLGSWALSDDSMKVGTSSTILGGMAFGTVAGTALAFGLGLANDPNQKSTQQSTLAVSLAGGGLGLGAGILGAWLTDPSAGDAAIVNSGGLWGAVAGVLLTESISFRRADHDNAFGWLTLGGTAAGIVTGGLLSHWVEVSRSHVAWIDLAGVLGTALGYGIGYAAGDDTADPTSGTLCPGSVKRCIAAARFGLGGMAVGLLVATIATRKYKYDLPRVEALITHHGAGWALGIPQLRLEIVPRYEGREQRAVLDLLRGEF